MSIILGPDSKGETTYAVSIKTLTDLVAKDLGVDPKRVTITAKNVTVSDVMDRDSWQQFAGITVKVTNE